MAHLLPIFVCVSVSVLIQMHVLLPDLAYVPHNANEGPLSVCIGAFHLLSRLAEVTGSPAIKALLEQGAEQKSCEGASVSAQEESKVGIPFQVSKQCCESIVLLDTISRWGTGICISRDGCEFIAAFLLSSTPAPQEAQFRSHTHMNIYTCEHIFTKAY